MHTRTQTPDPATPHVLDLSVLELDGARLVVIACDALLAALPTCLSPAEGEVCRLLVDGSSNEAIAAARETSVHTVVNQVRAVYEKLKVFSRCELTAKLFGLLDPIDADSDLLASIW